MITFFTDPHLGRMALSHTTMPSRKRLSVALFDNAMRAATLYDDPTVCVGDLFDKSYNPESIIKQGIQIAQECDLLIEGNHDLPNREGAVPSMRLVPFAVDASKTYVSSCDVGETRANFEHIDGITICAVPHHSSQALFEEALESALSMGGDIICLHCNYDSPFTEGFDTSLNLTPEMAEKLLAEFDYIVLGHEHNTRWECNGRLLILGNTHPTNFGDISDKFAWRFDPVADTWTKHFLWEKAEYYAELCVDELLLGINSAKIPPQVQFIEITGNLDSPHHAQILAQRMNQLWQQYEDTLYMVRNNTEANFDFAQGGPIDPKTVSSEKLTEHILTELKGTEMEPVFVCYVKQESGL